MEANKPCSRSLKSNFAISFIARRVLPSAKFSWLNNNRKANVLSVKLGILLGAKLDRFLPKCFYMQINW